MPARIAKCFFLLGLCAAWASAALAQGTQPGLIVLAKVTGPVTLTDKATNTTKPAAGVPSIRQGTIVTTGATGSVVLVFSNGSTVNVGKDSLLDIETFLQDPLDQEVKVADLKEEPTTSTTKLNLTRGEIVGDVKKLKIDKKSSFTVQTPVGAAGIRGTIFRIVFTPGANGKATFALYTQEGNVVFNSGTNATAPSPVEGQAADVAVATGNSVTVEVDIQVNPTTGAVTITSIPSVTQTSAATMTNEAKQTFSDAATAIVQAQDAAVFTPPKTGGGSADTGQSNTNNNTPPANRDNSSQQQQQQTTSGDGAQPQQGNSGSGGSQDVRVIPDGPPLN